jgi:hypothetical protein
MVFAIVHFTVGFVITLAVVSVLSLTRYKMTTAYLGGVWALAPDSHHLASGTLSSQIRTVHESQISDVFFLHYTFDKPFYRALNFELTAVSLAVLGIAFIAYDWRFGVIGPPRRVSSRGEISDD